MGRDVVTGSVDRSAVPDRLLARVCRDLWACARWSFQEGEFWKWRTTDESWECVEWSSGWMVRGGSKAMTDRHANKSGCRKLEKTVLNKAMIIPHTITAVRRCVYVKNTGERRAWR